MFVLNIVFSKSVGFLYVYYVILLQNLCLCVFNIYRFISHCIFYSNSRIHKMYALYKFF